MKTDSFDFRPIDDAQTTAGKMTDVLVSSYQTGGAGGDYYRYELKNVIVTSYQISGADGDAVPTDELTLNFAQIDYDYG
jgi:Hemolysin-coregulated protein (uncharacterized)